jgi:hypothetical protein
VLRIDPQTGKAHMRYDECWYCASASSLRMALRLKSTQVDPIGGYGHSLNDLPRDACQLDGREGEPSLRKLECGAQGCIKHARIKIERCEGVENDAAAGDARASRGRSSARFRMSGISWLA